MASATKSESKSKLKYRAIMKSMTGLVDVIDGGDPKKLALRLFQEQLLNENTYGELLSESTGTDKARKIVNELLKKVKVNPDERYKKLIEVLNKEEMFDAVKLIQEKYKEELKEESLCRRKSLPERNYTKRKDSRKRIHSELSPKSIKKHEMMGEDVSEIIQEEADDSSSDSQGQQNESGSFSSTLDVETDYPYRRSGTKANKPLPDEGEENLCRRKSLPGPSNTQRKDSRKRSHSAPSPKSITKHKMMGEATSEIIEEEGTFEADDSSSDSQGQQIESGSLCSTLDVETDYPSKIDELGIEFREIQCDFMKFLKSSRGRIKKFCGFLQYPTESLLGLEEYFSDDKDLENIDLRQLFLKLSKCVWNCFDCDVLRVSINICDGPPKLKEKMKSYERRVERLSMVITVEELLHNWSPPFTKTEIPDSVRTAVAEMNWKASTCTVHELRQLKNRLEGTLILRKTCFAAYALMDIKDGCVMATWLVFTNAWPELIEATRMLFQQDPDFTSSFQLKFFALDDFILYPCLDHDKLWNACREGLTQQVRELLKDMKADPNRVYEISQRSALQCTAKYGHQSCAELLLEYKASIDYQDKTGYTALMIAVKMDRSGMVNCLISGGANLTIQDYTSCTPLLSSAECNYLEITKVLLEGGADPNIYDQQGLSPLYQAAENGYLEIVKALVEESNFKIEINHTTKLAWPALFVAVKNGHEEIVEYLVEKNADIFYQKKDDTAALHLACLKENVFMTKLLIKKKANVNVQDRDGLTPLMFAASHGQSKLVRLLVEDGRANLNIADNMYQWTAVFFALKAKLHDVMKYLLDTEKINLNHQDGDGLTPLMFAASQGLLKLVRLLVEDGRADLNIAENMNQWTAVFFAMQAKHHDVMKYLLDTKRVKLNHKDEKGNTLFDLAETVNPEAFEYLKANFKEDEELSEQERATAGLPKLTAKILMGTGSPYYAPMIEKTYSKSSSGAAA